MQDYLSIAAKNGPIWKTTKVRFRRPFSTPPAYWGWHSNRNHAVFHLILPGQPWHWIRPPRKNVSKATEPMNIPAIEGLAIGISSSSSLTVERAAGQWKISRFRYLFSVYSTEVFDGPFGMQIRMAFERRFVFENRENRSCEPVTVLMASLDHAALALSLGIKRKIGNSNLGFDLIFSAFQDI